MEISAIIEPTLVILGMGTFLGILLGLADRYLKVEEDERVGKVLEMLPGYNCGSCGHPGCGGYATAIVDGVTTLADCKPLKPDAKENIIKYLSTTPGTDGATVDTSKL